MEPQEKAMDDKEQVEQTIRKLLASALAAAARFCQTSSPECRISLTRKGCLWNCYDKITVVETSVEVWGLECKHVCSVSGLQAPSVLGCSKRLEQGSGDVVHSQKDFRSLLLTKRLNRGTP